MPIRRDDMQIDSCLDCGGLWFSCPLRCWLFPQSEFRGRQWLLSLNW
ncbi:zf-TFIIB domain-containing protein [Massilia jejuensis]|uniref:Zf-TFIIB domain-containing protein n=1 Tax=Massilia jejuensis TaxID=648894 RepID=A0ABW0PD92_9BURK